MKEKRPKKKPTKKSGQWGLVLMGGGARGLAHIGVIEVLLENGLVPSVITGTSMGALVGGLFATGYLPREIEDLANQFNNTKLAKLRRSSIPIPDKLLDFLMFESYQKRLSHRLGLEKSGSFDKILKALVGDILIEDLPFRFGCNAVNLVTGKEVNFTNGPLYRALRASLAYPFVIEPARFARGVLIDGGLLNNVPIKLARQLGASKVLVPDVHRRLKRIPAGSIDSAVAMMDRLIQVILTESTESKLQGADLIININSEVDTFDFSKIKKLVNLGKRVTQSNLKDIKKMIRQAA